MAIVANSKIPPFDTPTIQAISRIFGDTSLGLTGAGLAYIFNQFNVPDIDTLNTKWKRLHSAFGDFQNKHEMANHIIRFISIAMSPASHIQSPERFKDLQVQLNAQYDVDVGKALFSKPSERDHERA